MKLSNSQHVALDLLAEGPVNDVVALINLGAQRQRTMRSLERIGFARYFPTPEHWKITPDGRAWRNDEDARWQLAELRAKT